MHLYRFKTRQGKKNKENLTGRFAHVNFSMNKINTFNKYHE